MRARGGLLALLALVIGCGGAPPSPSGPAIGTSGDVALAPAHPDAVELALRRPDGTFVDIGELRGAPLLLVVFATFDTTSQMLLRPLSELHEREPELRMVGVAAQPSARLLVDAYEHALSPPYTVTYDPEDVVAEGRSDLGEIALPTLIVLDARGVEVARHAGFADADRIAALVAQAQ